MRFVATFNDRGAVYFVNPGETVEALFDRLIGDNQHITATTGLTIRTVIDPEER